MRFRSVPFGARGVIAGVVALAVVVPVAWGSEAILSALSADESAPTDCHDELSTEDAARAEAVRCDAPVVVGEALDPWTTKRILPSGETELSSHITAVRAPDPEGGWRPVAPAFDESEPGSGRIEPAAPSVLMSFSDGSAGEPLAILEKDGHELVYDTPFGDLPEPRIDDDRLTYEAVVPGVDLIVTVNDDGSAFSEVLRVATEEALDHPALANLTFPVEVTDGLGLEEADDGGFEAVEITSGDVVFSAPQPQAWDSAGDHDLVSQAAAVSGSDEVELSAENEAAVERLVRARSDLVIGENVPQELVDDAAEVLAEVETDVLGPESTDEASGDLVAADVQRPVNDRLSAPVDGDAVAPLKLEVVEGGLRLTPDPSLLADAVFPLHLDPTAGGSYQDRAFIQSAYPSTTHFNDTATENLKIGVCTSKIGCSTTNKTRSAYQWKNLGEIGDLASGDITKATFKYYGNHSYSCTTRVVEIWRTDAIGSSTDWDNFGPSSGKWRWKVAGKSVAHKAACPQGTHQRWVEFGVKDAATWLAGQGGSRITLGLRASSAAESNSDVVSWKRATKTATLVITYNRTPNVPAKTYMDLYADTDRVDCVTSAGSAPYISDATPLLSAKVSDPDGGTVKAGFQVLNGSGSQVWKYEWKSVSSGTRAEVTVPSGELGTGTYSWRARTYDGSRSTSYSSSPRCYFKVDVTKPPAPRVSPVIPTGSGSGIEAVYEEGTLAGGVGLTGKFRVDSSDTSDVDVIEYGFDQATTPNTVTPGSDGTVVLPPYTPQVAGPVTLYVRAKDKAGNRTTTARVYQFQVAEAREDGIWTFDETSGSVAGDSAGQDAGDLTISGATRADGPHFEFGARSDDRSLSFDGTNDAAVSEGPILDTRESFVISVHVLLDGLDSWDTAIAQEGVHSNGVRLGYSKTGCAASTGAGCWSFAINTSEYANSPAYVKSDKPVVTGEWVHLLAEHDAGEDKLRLWVCEAGTPSKPARAEPRMFERDFVAPATQMAPGRLLVGRGQIANNETDWWSGNIDNLRIFEGEVVSEPKIRRLCQGAEATDFTNGVSAIDPTEAVQ
ncbi:hypothetical protein GCM10027059_18210 [Myceligenerans halotolerans]